MVPVLGHDAGTMGRVRINPHNPVRVAVKKAGGVVFVGTQLGVSTQAVSYWCQKGWVSDDGHRNHLALLADVPPKPMEPPPIRVIIPETPAFRRGPGFKRRSVEG